MAHYTLPPGMASRNKIFGEYRYQAKKRGHVFELSVEDFTEITSQDCHYCGAEPRPRPLSQTENYNGAYSLNGLDRLDNSQGYTLANVVACCRQCNWAKGSLGYDEFVAWLFRASEHVRRFYT